MRRLATHIFGSKRDDVNHVGMNLGGFRGAGPIRATDYPTYSDALLDWYQARNVKAVRLMFTWEAVQSTSGGSVPPAAAGFANYWSDLTGLITRLLARGIHVSLSPWQYNSRSGDTDIVYHDAAFTPEQFGDFWGKFAAAINLVTGNDQRVAFDLINEPHTHAESGGRTGDIGISLTNWFACAQAAITAIRTAAAANAILVPGMAYSDAASFITNGSAAQWLTLNDPLKNIAVTVHCCTGLGSSSATVLPDACADLVAWARMNSLKVQIGDVAINAGANGRTALCGTLATAHDQSDEWNDFYVANSDVLVGWHWWANSAARDWWNQGDSCDPAGLNWGLTLDDGATQTVYMNLIEATMPVADVLIHDHAAGTGLEANTKTAGAWKRSLDISVTQPGSVSGAIEGATPAVVHVHVTNNGKGTYPGDAGHVVRLYWAKVETGIAWPQPRDGSVRVWPAHGGKVNPPQLLHVIPPGFSETVSFEWTPPDPAAYMNEDGRFCLLAFVTPAGAPEFERCDETDLNVEVLKVSNVAWRSIQVSAKHPRPRITARS